MEPTHNDPDDVTQAALEAVSEAVELADADKQPRRALLRRNHVELADADKQSRRALRRRRPPGRLRGRLTGDTANQGTSLRRLGAVVGRTTRRGAHLTGRRFATSGRWLSSQVLAMAPRLPVRDLATLREQFPGKSPDELADTLIDGASRASAAVGVAVGAWAVLPFLPAVGVEIATETLAVVGIEI